MVLLDRIRKNFAKAEKEKAIEQSLEQAFAQNEEDINDKEYFKKNVKTQTLSLEDYCNQLIDTSKQLDQRKIEYEQVTAYLSDIQLIDQMTPEEKSKVEEIAAKLVILTGDREDIKSESKRLSDLQFRYMQLHEEDIENGIAHITEQEKYQSQIRSDLQKLEEEKGNLKQEERFYLQKLNNFKMITWSVIFMTIIISGVIIFAYTLYEFDLFLSILVVLVCLAVIGTMIFLKYRNVNYALAYCRKQQAKAVQLLNRVKIKAVNNTATLDYLYAKYNVGSARELAFLWEQYAYIIENEEKYKRSTKELSRWGDELVKLLKKIGVHDADIWTYQAIALIDSREMVEVTHNLNTRRQRLREGMEYDEDVLDLVIDGIKEGLKKEPQKASIIQNQLEQHHIRI